MHEERFAKGADMEPPMGSLIPVGGFQIDGTFNG
jgi:hypothetical protein